MKEIHDVTKKGKNNNVGKSWRSILKNSFNKQAIPGQCPRLPATNKEDPQGLHHALGYFYWI
ncbi:hypothetical protein L211DRAFT_840756 [Terfezia boudieri ATCC MYA-4762]|uniref:Uncharacterized protein n=1 Tax=Terfezia boudieri ATCC MYA-4762 TaxID=1051890 RepID=A0A3N4LEL3_9PEZI|nr:hypothetical protein L211DRAFT_840756 [Terfezia boudieri ATCC MYA-4762]